MTFSIDNQIATLPRNYTTDIKWAVRTPMKIKQIVVHQALGTKTALDTARYHTSKECHVAPRKGLPSISYTFFIEPSGKIIQCCDLTEVTWHVKNENTISLGICLGGFYNYGTTVCRDGDPPPVQIEALRWLLNYLIELLKLDKGSVYTHDERQGKPACPGNSAAEFIKQFRS